MRPKECLENLHIGHRLAQGLRARLLVFLRNYIDETRLSKLLCCISVPVSNKEGKKPVEAASALRTEKITQKKPANVKLFDMTIFR